MAEYLTARYTQMYMPFCVMNNPDLWSGAVSYFLVPCVELYNTTEILCSCVSYTVIIRMN
jgi:hypothetical protein